MKNSKLPTFQRAFLAPKYWGFWLGLGIWRMLLLLPYPILHHIGNGLGWFFSHLSVGKRRAAIARRNLELCFPDMPENERETLLQENLRSVGMAIIETGMAWFWSDARIKKWSKIEGLHHLKESQQNGIIFVGVHFLTLELGARIVGLHHPGLGVYRPNDNPLMDWLQTQGRLRSNKDMLDRKDLRGMIKALRQGETIWYAPDHDYGRKNAVFVPFFAVPDACTTTGSYYLLKSSPKSKIIPFAPLRNRDSSGYTVSISPPVDFTDLADETSIAMRMNRLVEKEILKGVAQYMWLHRRFKTRPNENDPSLYD
ncbi:Kdo(2)-lipid IV(A) acyltransferase [Rodentibacter pneumotropicus]|uniref:Lipid A biosynthesis acyltransferase n=1 Tax=Rodentibacter pneumotropicus TaxID=758 RepID=A0A4S2QJN9_9PAST|nr:Kdo(2)-lipid IV(A) acyltransferase [Rodentibacter pneumotropicus]TGZ99025.1 LpxL/LpxP family Kdo(2)-lipid IV(A) lauroyl/palmitoleoyl acyltransferase [Rodentibacter pneumotropicus]THA03244.1 LpxL/LpxP family Kdo(2)-lipid IV(A) lauroyl/palmitoleoyl acyltransferase [Rodentibacter pneumotropicus]THA08620.1 LpxL/LpxP family Kdo(2)-lipid IV(A) lauroyl/palmitoleoyl acyltransferase [Rodentibacter pneumotropicus]THA17498.1 LpxL/LpxP family Kdo(2)-lipid IV(A) lauroyl/palmitoleoyl acyltransferase [Rode